MYDQSKSHESKFLQIQIDLQKFWKLCMNKFVGAVTGGAPWKRFSENVRKSCAEVSL